MKSRITKYATVVLGLALLLKSIITLSLIGRCDGEESKWKV